MFKSLECDTKMKNTKLMGLAVAGVIVATMMLSATLSVTNVFASTANEWGNLASEMGQAGKMGVHSSDPNHDGDKGDGPRIGVGQLDLRENDGDLDNDDDDRATPGENAEVLRALCENAPEDDPKCP